MRYRLHAIAMVLFALCLAYDLVVWGSVDALGEIGTGIADSARREAPLATTYIGLGRVVDSAVPFLLDFGGSHLADALAGGLDRIRENPTAAVDLIFGDSWSPAHRWLKATYWATPILLILALVLWTRRPRQLHVVRR